MDNSAGKMDDGEISTRDILIKIKSAIKFLKKKWRIILTISLLGASLGLAYSLFKKITYVAISTFVLEDPKSGGLGQYAGLASLAGININTGGGSVFEGDNILELYKSRTMIEKALLDSCNFDGKTQLLIDRYIDYNGLRNKWKEKEHINNIDFKGNSEKFNRKQDSIITDIVGLINKNILYVDKPDKKLSIVYVSVSTHDELFSKDFNDKLVEKVNEFYIQTKTKKANENVQILQHQADSVKMTLNFSIKGVASANDAAPNANPLLSSLRVASQKKQIDVQANTAIYGEMVKNLELAKISLRQETPLIQIIDKPVLPLSNNHGGRIKSTILGFVLGFFLSIFFLTTQRLLEIFSKL